MNERRLAKVCITQEFILMLLTEGYERIRPVRTVRGVPESAVHISTYYDHQTMYTYWVFEHPSFEPVPLGEEPPLIDVTFKTWYEPEAEEIYRKAMGDENRK